MLCEIILIVLCFTQGFIIFSPFRYLSCEYSTNHLHLIRFALLLFSPLPTYDICLDRSLAIGRPQLLKPYGFYSSAVLIIQSEGFWTDWPINSSSFSMFYLYHYGFLVGIVPQMNVFIYSAIISRIWLSVWMNTYSLCVRVFATILVMLTYNRFNFTNESNILSLACLDISEFFLLTIVYFTEPVIDVCFCTAIVVIILPC